MNNTSACRPAKYNVHEIVQSGIHPSLPNPERGTYTLQASYTNRIRNIYRSMLLNATPVNGVMGSEGLCYSPSSDSKNLSSTWVYNIQTTKLLPRPTSTAFSAIPDPYRKITLALL